MNESCSEDDAVNFMTFGDLTIDHQLEQLHICTMSYQRLKAVLDMLKESGAALCLRDGVLDSEDGGVGIRKARPISKAADCSHADGEASVAMAYTPAHRASEELVVKKSAEKRIQRLTLQCANCNSVPQVGQKFQKCSRCQAVYFCNKECQASCCSFAFYMALTMPFSAGCTLEDPQAQLPKSLSTIIVK